jgi:hypothetical protein
MSVAPKPLLTGPDVVTILRTQEAGSYRKLLTKRWTVDGEGKPFVKGYDKEKYFTAETRRVGGLEGLYTLLSDLADDPYAAIIRGALVDLTQAGLARRTSRDQDDERPDFADEPRLWLCCDLDDKEITPFLDLAAKPEGVAKALRSLLPTPFGQAACIVQFSCSTGHPTKFGKVSAHLWFWLSKPVTSAELRDFFRGHAEIDSSTFKAVQLHYVANPIIDDRTDPIGQRLVRLDGAQAIDLPVVKRAASLAQFNVRDDRPKAPHLISRFTSLCELSGVFRSKIGIFKHREARLAYLDVLINDLGHAADDLEALRAKFLAACVGPDDPDAEADFKEALRWAERPAAKRLGIGTLLFNIIEAAKGSGNETLYEAAAAAQKEWRRAANTTRAQMLSAMTDEERAKAKDDAFMIAYATVSKVLDPKIILLAGQDGNLAGSWSDAVAIVAERVIFKSPVGNQLVRVMPRASLERVPNIAPDNFGDLSSLPVPPVAETAMTRDELNALMRDATRFYSLVEIPDLQENTTVEFSSDGATVSWDEMRNRKLVRVTAKTCAWAETNAFNAQVLEHIDREKIAWLSSVPPRDHRRGEAVTRLSRGDGYAATWKLDAVATAPCLSADGRPIVENGFHPSCIGAGLYVSLGELRDRVEVPSDEILKDPVASAPLVEGAKAALRHLAGQFPYADPVAESVIVAMFLTQIARMAFKLCPAFIVDAPQFGTGKTFLASYLASLAGMGVSVVACGTDDGDNAEIRKRFETAVTSGRSGTIIFDDVPGGRIPNVESMRTFLTSEIPTQMRILGESRDVEVEPGRHIIVFTGNNVATTRDMPRRCMHAYLDRHEAERRGWQKQTAELELDKFIKYPQERGRIMGAALTILRFNLLHRPCRQAKATENFERWSEIVREAAILVTGADSQRSQDLLKASDMVAERNAELASHIAVIVGLRAKFTTGDITSRMTTLYADFGVAGQPDESAAALRALAEEFGWPKGQSHFRQRLGGWLKRNRRNNFETELGLLRLEYSEPETRDSNDRGTYVLHALRLALPTAPTIRPIEPPPWVTQGA